MGRRKNGAEPEMRFHAHSGQARVRVNGKVIYLGPWDSPEAKERYHRIVAEWHAHPTAGLDTRRPSTPTKPAATPAAVRPTRQPAEPPPPPAGLTLAEVCVLWVAHCDKKYTRADGTKSSTIHESNMIVRALEPDSAMPAASFKARALVTLQQRLVAAGRPRVTVNRIVKGVRRLFRWATVMEYVPESVVQALEAVEPLRKGQTEAAELPPVTDVPEDHVEAVLRHMHRIPADLVRFIRLVGCRPGEACLIRPMDVDTSGSEWRWDVPAHKTSWRGHDRTYWIGPRAQAVLAPYLRRAPEAGVVRHPARGQGAPRALEAGLQHRPAAQCPEVPSPGPGGAAGYVNGGCVSVSSMPPDKTSRTGLSCYRANFGKGTGGNFDTTDGEGALRYKTRRGFADMRFGTSNSLLLIENAFGAAWAAGVPTLTTANDGSDNAAINKAALGFRGSMPNVGISSEHQGGAAVAMVDGSTHFLDYGGLSDTIWRNLMQVNDRNPVSLP